MSRHQRLVAANLNPSPKARNSNSPDPTWKAQQAFIRATRRGSKKHTSMEQKLKLLDAATAAITAKKVVAPPPPGLTEAEVKAANRARGIVDVDLAPAPTFSGVNLSPRGTKP